MPATTSRANPRVDGRLGQTTSHPGPPPRKTRTVRRRGRGRGDFGSDDEFVREVGTDSESDDDDNSSVGSSTDSDTEPVSEDIPSTTPSRILTPNTTQSSADVPSINGSASKPTKGGDAGTAPPFFGDTGNWSEMVAEETAHGPAELPVVEFPDLTASPMEQRSKPTPPRKPSKPTKRPPVKRAASAPTVDRPAAHSPLLSERADDSHLEPVSDHPVPSTSRQSSQSSFRRPGQSARQAYQQRLETDPSYVPTVGEFWGHDDRLLDKNLRSLSGWWRGRRQGRGRGRFDRGFIRGRGRGTTIPGPGPALSSAQSEDGPATQENPPIELPRIDQPWTHDGFEEMKKRDEKKREVAQQAPPARPSRGFSPLRGRGGFVGGRGRGGTARGGGGVTQHSLRPTAPAVAAAPTKIWYPMRPEYPWTKHLEMFLFHDSGPKPRAGSSPSYRVKLPNVEVHIVRGSVQVGERPKPPPSLEPHSPVESEKNIVVRLPKRTTKEKVVRRDSAPTTTVKEPHLEDVFTVRPELVPPRAPIVDIELSSATAAAPDVASTAGPSAQPANPSVTPSSPTTLPTQAQAAQPVLAPVDGVFHGHQDTVTPTLLKVDTPRAPEPQEVPGSRRTLPPVPPPLQTVFSPPQSSPPYSSPYGYGSPLPPGIAISQHGMAYEIATGRPVYLPAPIYTPRPLAHGMMTPPGVSYMPGHIHHHSTGSPDFLSAPHTPPINGFIDPTTGGPIFAFPRQSSRIEIRAPSQLEPKSAKSQRRPSNLRTSAAAFEPSRSSSPVNEAESSVPGTEPYVPHGDANAASEQQMDSAMYNYAAYSHAYYYPEQYGYSQYYDTHMPRYEMYQTDPQASQAVYY